MHAHDLLVNHTTHRHTIEDVAELLPHLDVVAALALIVEAVDARDRGTLVVSTQLKEVFWILHLQSSCLPQILITYKRQTPSLWDISRRKSHMFIIA